MASNLSVEQVRKGQSIGLHRSWSYNTIATHYAIKSTQALYAVIGEDVIGGPITNSNAYEALWRRAHEMFDVYVCEVPT